MFFLKKGPIKHKEGHFEGTGGLKLFYQSWHPDGKHKAVLVFVHGICEHSGRYQNLVKPLTEKGYALYGMDLRGHGRSEGSLNCHINAWEEFRSDLDAFLKMVSSVETGKPLFLLGHSLGSLIVLDYLLMNNPLFLKGVMISGAAIEPAGVAKPYLVQIARFLSAVAPKVSLKLKIDAQGLSRDPQVLKEREEDPLVHDRASVRFGTEALDRIEWIKAHLSKLKTPILLVHGGADRLNLPEGSQRIYDECAATDKELYIHPGGFHEPHNDFGHEEVAKAYVKWLDKHA